MKRKAYARITLVVCVISILLSGCAPKRVQTQPTAAPATHAERQQPVEEKESGLVEKVVERVVEVEKEVARVVDSGNAPQAAPLFGAGRPAPMPTMMPGPIPQPNTEEYATIDEVDFRDARTTPLSTFSIDVDTASYSNVRRFLNNGQLPPANAVRIEEMINYFDYDYPKPTGHHPFAVFTEVTECPWQPAHQIVHIGLQGRHVPKHQLPPSNLVFLLDVSGSMNQPDKLPLLKDAFRLLTRELDENDSVAIVVYAGAAGVVLTPTSGDNQRAILGAMERLRAGGSTAGGQGIQLAYGVAEAMYQKGANNRVILATDGDFNVGVSSDAELVRLIERKRDSGIYLTVLGFGTGNYKDSKMEQLADKGNGNVAYIDSVREAEKVLVKEMAGTLVTIAKDVKLQIEFNPAKVQSYRLIGYENRALAKEDFADDAKDAGELGVGHTVTALYEVIPWGTYSPYPAPTIALRYQNSEVDPAAATSDELINVKLRYKPPTSDTSVLLATPILDRAVPLMRSTDDTRFALAVAEFGLLLRGSAFKGGASYKDVIQLANGSEGWDPNGYRTEFIALVRQAERLDRY